VDGLACVHCAFERGQCLAEFRLAKVVHEWLDRHEQHLEWERDRPGRCPLRPAEGTRLAGAFGRRAEEEELSRRVASRRESLSGVVNH